MRFCKTFKFERMGAFTYSEEDGTPAADLPDQVSFMHCGKARTNYEAGSQSGSDLGGELQSACRNLRG